MEKPFLITVNENTKVNVEMITHLVQESNYHVVFVVGREKGIIIGEDYLSNLEAWIIQKP